MHLGAMIFAGVISETVIFEGMVFERMFFEVASVFRL